jgi:polysaccharide biosynthesis/export protein
LTLKKFYGYCLVVVFFCGGCSSYRQNIMFRMPDGQSVPRTVSEADVSNYLIQKNDLLTLDVHANFGEQIIDPTPEAAKTDLQKGSEPLYLVDDSGVAKFPLLQPLKVEGLTLRQAEEALEKEYAKFYQQPFVKLNYSNKRVVVLGAPGGQVIPLANENMRLTEVLALCKGVTNDSKVSNIRILRGQEVLLADLTTIEGYKKCNYVMQPNDVVYIEPIRRPLSEAVRDYGPLVAAITSLTTLIVVIIGLN